MVREELYTRYCESSKSLECDCGMDSVQRCRFLSHFKKVHTFVSSGKKSKFCKQGGKLDYSRYSEAYLY